MAFDELGQPPRTLAHCADHGLTLRCYCKGCGDLRITPAAQVCRSFRDWTIDELQRAGALGCGACRQPMSISIYGTYWVTHPMQIEHWSTGEHGWVRKRSDGMSG